MTTWMNILSQSSAYFALQKVVINRSEPSSAPQNLDALPSIDFGFDRPGVNGLGLLRKVKINISLFSLKK